LNPDVWLENVIVYNWYFKGKKEEDGKVVNDNKEAKDTEAKYTNNG